MKLRAPNVFRWTKRMFEQGFADPEFPDLPPGLPDGDAIPKTTAAVLENLFGEFSAELGAMLDSYNAWCDARPDAAAGTVIQDPDEPGTTHPSLGWIEFCARGVKLRRRDSVDVVYHLQRVINVVEALPADARRRFDELIEATGGAALMHRRPLRRIAYRHFKYVLE